MAVREILIYPDDRLRAPTVEVTVFDDALKALVQDMFDSMYHYDGIGLAAPQIGVSKKVVVIDIADVDSEGQVLKHNPMESSIQRLLKRAVASNTKRAVYQSLSTTILLPVLSV